MTMRLVTLAGWVTAALLCLIVAMPLPVAAIGTYDQGAAAGQSTYSLEEMVETGHTFFGNTTKGVAQAIEYVFQVAGRPSGYIIGEEASAAFVGGLRYGEGTLYLASGGQQKVYWQGPSLGYDAGAGQNSN